MRCKLNHPAAYPRGIAFTDLLLCVSVICVLAGVGMSAFPGLRSSVDRGRMARDVRVLNQAIATYLNSGGVIPANATADSVLAKLKSTPTAANARTVAGLRGTMVDIRLKGRPSRTGDSGGRIVWDRSSQVFRVAESGSGWTEMYYDNSEVNVARAAENRRTTQSFASSEPWVWDYRDGARSARGPVHLPVSDPSVTQPVLDEPSFVLLPPVISPDAGIYDYRDFPMAVTLRNPNPGGASNVRYQIDGAGWNTWTGAAMTLPRELTHSVEAFAESVDGETWQQSTKVTANYVTYFVRGEASGSFSSPAGEARMQQNTTAGGRVFEWGRAESGGQAHSSLEFIPGKTFEAGPGESFPVATLRYSNGLSRAGTNATGVNIAVSLPLTVPAGTTVGLNIPVRMQNTVHYPWTNPADYKDFVWIPGQVAVAAPVTILDRTYRLTLFASAPNSSMDGTDLKVPIGEGASAEVSFTGRLDIQ